MRKKLLSRVLSLVLAFSVLNMGAIANAESLSEDTENPIEIAEISSDEMEAEVIAEMAANVMERSYVGESYTYTEGVSAYSDSEESTSNTDPNYAYMVTNDTVMQGAIGAANEMRWYAFSISEESKISIVLQMVETLDADLYLFQLNEETYGLELIGGSANAGAGVSEYFNDVMDAGIYFFAISGYEGTGQFAFAYYQSTADVASEINDTMATATTVSFSSNVIGVIDSPYDIDYYKFTVATPTIIQYSISSSNGYSLLYAGKSGSSSAIYTVNSSTKSYKLMPGTYYFAVLSENGSYSATSTYTVNFKKVGAMSGDSLVTLVGISEDAGFVYETNSIGSINYVNGNPVDISYSYKENLSNSAGAQTYDISIDTNVRVYAVLSDLYEPVAVHYFGSTKPAMSVGSRPALMLTFYGEKDFYHINCTGTGAYKMNTLWEDFSAVTVLIDPSTGKLIDIVEFNYYYDFAPVGTNFITYTNSYKLDYYNN
ncbi:MAG: hypothetical protein HDQ98_08840 [Lachnospiraceae bacterium]|nr:hypothetical protein [Lachnospiraceae bacterium]